MAKEMNKRLPRSNANPTSGQRRAQTRSFGLTVRLANHTWPYNLSPFQISRIMLSYRLTTFPSNGLKRYDDGPINHTNLFFDELPKSLLTS